MKSVRTWDLDFLGSSCIFQVGCAKKSTFLVCRSDFSGKTSKILVSLGTEISKNQVTKKYRAETCTVSEDLETGVLLPIIAYFKWVVPKNRHFWFVEAIFGEKSQD